MTDRPRIVDPDPEVERILGEMDAKVNRPIVDLAGNPLFKPVVEDRTITYAKDGEEYSLDPEELLKRAARMQRDGKSLKAIYAELDLKDVPMSTLENALRLGRALLEHDIAAGIEPEESVTVLGYVPIDEETTLDAQTPEDVEAALKMGEGLRGG